MLADDDGTVFKLGARRRVPIPAVVVVVAVGTPDARSTRDGAGACGSKYVLDKLTLFMGLSFIKHSAPYRTINWRKWPATNLFRRLSAIRVGGHFKR